jgi:periplasmic copper chaperone A
LRGRLLARFGVLGGGVSKADLASESTLRLKTFILLALSTLAWSSTAWATGVAVTGAWARPALPGMTTGVIYLTATNHGRAPDRLLGAATPVAASASLHQSMSMGGMAEMTAVRDGLALPPGGTAHLAPGGYHLMLMGLKRGLKVGERFPAILRFAHAGAVPVQVEVRQTAP